MIEFIVLLILVIFFAILMNFLFSSIAVVLVNIPLVALITARAAVDIKENNMLSYYIASMAVTAILFIFKGSILLKPVFDFLDTAYVIVFVQALFLIFVIAHLLAFLYALAQDLIKKYMPKK